MHGGFEVKLNSCINILRYFKMVIKTAGVVLRAKQRCVVCKTSDWRSPTNITF